MRRLNFGCGSIQPVGWTNFDREDHGQDYGGEANDWFYDGQFGLVVAHCALQINTYDEIPGLLANLYRVLKPGGVLRVSLPDICAGFDAYTEDRIDWFPNSEPNLQDRFSNWLTWYSTTRSLWTVGAICNRLFEAGFSRVDLQEFGKSSVPNGAELDSREHECFFIEATK